MRTLSDYVDTGYYYYIIITDTNNAQDRLGPEVWEGSKHLWNKDDPAGTAAKMNR